MTLRVLASTLSVIGRMSAHHSFFPVFFSLKAPSLKGISVQAITSFGKNTVIQALGQSEILCALSGAKIMLTVRKKD